MSSPKKPLTPMCQQTWNLNAGFIFVFFKNLTLLTRHVSPQNNTYIYRFQALYLP